MASPLPEVKVAGRIILWIEGGGEGKRKGFLKNEPCICVFFFLLLLLLFFCLSHSR